MRVKEMEKWTRTRTPTSVSTKVSETRAENEGNP